MKKNCLTFLALCFFATAVMAHGGYVHLKGTITKIDGGTISIQTPGGDAKQFTVTADTKITRKMPATGTQSADTPATLQDLQVGDRVVVHVKPQGSTYVAHEITFVSTRPPLRPQ
jgi:type 1 fimbria pilin